MSHLQDLIRTPQYCPRLWTANGVTKADQEVPLFISELNEKCVTFVLKNTPDALTMGRRCMCDGYAFVWRAHSTRPYFRRPDGTRISLTVDHYVPYLPTDLDDAAIAVGDSGNESADSDGSEEATLANPKRQKTDQVAATSTEGVQVLEFLRTVLLHPPGRERVPLQQVLVLGVWTRHRRRALLQVRACPTRAWRQDGAQVPGLPTCRPRGVLHPHPGGRLQAFRMPRLCMNPKASPENNISLMIHLMLRSPILRVPLSFMFVGT